MRVYVDNQSAYTVSAASVNTNINLTLGGHYIVVVAWDSAGAAYASSGFNIKVVSIAAVLSSLISDIQSFGGWSSCDTCAGPGGKGHPAQHWMAQFISSPSLDGKTTEYFLGKTTDGNYNYSNALFFKPLVPSATANNFVLDFYVYATNPSVIQGLEMDVYYSRGGAKNYFLTECDSRGMYAGTWQVSDAVHDQWQHTGLSCHLNAYSWNHVVLQFHRNPDGSTNFVSVSMNGDQHIVNRNFAALAVNSFEMNVAIQLDGDEKQDPIWVWADAMKLSYW
jgi:hypothetical protein